MSPLIKEHLLGQPELCTEVIGPSPRNNSSTAEMDGSFTQMSTFLSTYNKNLCKYNF